jgi:hypothetical protein
MVIQFVEPDRVLLSARESLGLPTDAAALDPPLLASLVRRAVGFLCPCSPATLAANVRESLNHLADDASAMSAAVDETIEALAIGGDLLELSRATIENSDAKANWLFAAPPSFVMRPGGGAFILGCMPDEADPLPQSLASRIEREGTARIIRPLPGEPLRDTLRDLGLHELSEPVWLRLPKAQTASGLLNDMSTRMLAQGPSGTVENLELLLPDTPVAYYRGRWTTAKNQTGHFVARRPQAYGASLWGYAALENGALLRFLDLPLRRTHFRGCDAAWHLQCAIDHIRGTPQHYRRRKQGSEYRFDFFSPLPIWAQRRFALIGRPIERERSLFSFVVPANEAPEHEAFLTSYLWLAATTDSD